jgi:hypothetical protein
LQAQLGLPQVLRAVEMLPGSKGPWPVMMILLGFGVGLIFFNFVLVS